MKTYTLLFLLLLTPIVLFAQQGSENETSGQADMPVSCYINAAVLDDSIVHIVWENHLESTINTVIVERSIDGSAWSFVNSAVLHNLPDIHALYYPEGMNYFNTVLFSTEHGNGRCIYNDVFEENLHLNHTSILYRIKMQDFDGRIYVSPAVDGFGNSQYVVHVAPDEDIFSLSLKGDPKPACPSLGTPPSGMNPTSQTQTLYGDCCFYVNTLYQASIVQIPCGGGSYAWCCNNVPGAGNCQSGHVWDPCCVHYCNQYYSCACHPWNCCTMSQTTQWVTTQSVNDPPIQVSAQIVNETCTGLFDGSITLTLTNGTNPINFNWSNGATTQNISTLAAGNYTVSISDAHNCTSTQTFVVGTNPPPVVTLTPMPSFCEDAQPFVLSGGNPLGGTFSGNSVTNGIFYPPVAGPGTHPITYTFIDGNNCVGTAVQNIIVHPKPTVSFNAVPDVCLTLASFNLNQGSPAGGTYYGVGLNGSNFSPLSAGPGTHTLLYVYTDGNNCTDSATQTVTVNPMPFATFNPIPQVCIDGAPITLTQASPAGGVYSGNGVSGGVFDPVAAGVGTHQITYIISDPITSCADTAFQNVVVNPKPVVGMQVLQPVCLGNQAFPLYGGTPAGGNYFGTGISGNIFNPAQAGAGTFDILYVYTSAANCTDSAMGSITVNPLPVVTFDPISPVCADAPSFQLAGGSPLGGTYSGTGVTGTTFNPATAGAGMHLITYSYTDPFTSCTNIATQTITVHALPNVVLPVFQNICITTPTFQLTGGSPGGGIYTGQGVNGNIYDPMSAGVGSWPILYTYTNPNTGCVSSATQTINVAAGINVSVTPAQSAICPGEHSQLIATGGMYYNWLPSSGLTPASGSPVNAAPFVTTTYSVLGTDDVGCTGSTTATVNVYPGVNVAIVANPIAGCKPLTSQFFFMPSPLDSLIFWNFDDPGSSDNTSNLQNPVHTFEQEGVYYPNITVVNSYGCVGYDSIPVNVYRIPVADFYNHPEVGSLESPTITFNDQSLYANYWYWTFGDPFSGPADTSNLQFPVHIYSDTGTYTVTLVVESQNGCSDTTQREIIILPDIHVYVPNAFTPYGDYINDIFQPVITGIDFNSFRMFIYNRWGEKVYETTDYNKGWDGRKDGKVVQQSVYTWLIFFNSVTGREYKMIGHLTVLRNN
jgi:gliding motility-associated-like protein